MSLLNILPIAGSAVSAQSQRLNTVASNLANADSVAGPDGTAYKARQVVFKAQAEQPRSLLDRGASLSGTAGARAAASPGVDVVSVVEDPSPGRRLFDPKHPLADEEGYVTHSNVNVVEEMVNMISATRSYQNNIEMMNTAQQLASKTLQLGL
ncbi:MAG: flagellar basal body rod protein FlgC [Lautropia sp.]